MNRLTRTTLGLVGLVSATTLGIGSAHARELVYYQDWQEADAFTQSWVSTGGCTTFSRDPGNPPPNVQSVTPVAPDCSGRYAAETIRWSGGRSSSRTTVAAANNDKFCVTAWIRSNSAGGDRAQPYIGLNFSTSATGFPDNQGSVGGCRNGEHWLIGDPGFSDNDYRNITPGCDVALDNCCSGRSTTGYGLVTPVPADAVGWNFYTKEFSVKPSDVKDGATNIILKLQNFSNGGSDSCGAVAPAADFDDIRVYKLGVGESCPVLADMAAEGDDAHAVCNGTKPFCTSNNIPVTVAGIARQVPQTSCVGCTAGYGTAVETACPEATPGCAADGSCSTCDGDSGTGTQKSCGGAHPVCSAGGLCGTCLDNNDCLPAAGVTRGGGLCVLGACTDACTIDPGNGASATCGDNRFCVESEANPGCRDKLANGASIPVRAQEAAAAQGKCLLPADGAAHTTATLFCASGVCSKADDKCGLAAGEACTPETGAAQCRAGVCGADSKCGLDVGAACIGNDQCRAGDCIGGNCGGALLECTPENVAIKCGPVGFACDATNRCAIGCQNGAHCPEGKTCTSMDASVGQCVDASSSSSSGGASSSSGGASSSGNTSSSGATTSSSGATSGEISSSSGNATSGGTSGDGGSSGDDEDGGGCSTGGGGAGSLTPMLFGLGIALGALRRRRSNGAQR